MTLALPTTCKAVRFIAWASLLLAVTSPLCAGSALAQQAGSSCTTLNKVYSPWLYGYADNNTYICNGSTLVVTQTATASPLSVDFLGTVGIGTASPAATLQVAAGTSSGTNGYGLEVAAPSGATNNYAAAFTGGYVGIGTASPQGILDVEGGTATAYNGSGGSIRLIAGNGNVVNSNGGSVVIQAGIGAGYGGPGNISLTPGTGATVGVAIPTGSGVSILVGADTGATTESYNVQRTATIGMPHVSNGLPVALIGGTSGLYGANYVYIGGGFSAETPAAAVLITGLVGIGTTSPQATLDVNGYARLTLNSSAPVTCSSTNQGAVALNHLAQMCSCNGSSWIFADSTRAACSW